MSSIDFSIINLKQTKYLKNIKTFSNYLKITSFFVSVFDEIYLNLEIELLSTQFYWKRRTCFFVFLFFFWLPKFIDSFILFFSSFTSQICTEISKILLESRNPRAGSLETPEIIHWNCTEWMDSFSRTENIFLCSSIQK